MCSQLTFRRNMSPPSSSSVWYLLHAGFLLGSFFDPEDGGSRGLRHELSSPAQTVGLWV
jgi:hypothetical protein